MKKCIIFTAILPLIGCIQVVPKVTSTGPNTYLLSERGSGMASKSRLENKLIKKAEKVCQSKGYTKLNDSVDVKHSNAYTQGMVVPVSMVTIQMNIKCNE